jgi:hypothetical protein
MRRIPILTLAFSIAFAIFVLGPPFLKQPFGPYPLVKVADIFDIFTPLVLIPLYWLLFRHDAEDAPNLAENLVFLVFVSFWVLGQGMHLSANSIGHLLEGMTGTDAFRVTAFYDEKLSHYLWHFGVISLSGLLIYRQWRKRTTAGKSVLWPSLLAGVIYGFVFFAMVIEGTTLPMGLPFAVLAIVFTVIRGRIHLREKPLQIFLLTGYSVAVLLFAVWGIWQGGFPEFSKVGII